MFDSIKKKLTKISKYERINHAVKSQFLRVCLKIVCAPIFFGEVVWNDAKTRAMEKANQFPYQFGLVAIIKNEGPYIVEWIEYHKLMGVDKFYIYDNESTDNIREILKKYIESGEVTYVYYPGKLRQLEAYKDAVQRYRFDCKLLGCLDIDEFLMPADGHSRAIDLLNNLFSTYKDAGAIAVNWRHYGSGNHINQPDGLVIENYLYRANDDFHRNALVKTICNPRRVAFFINPHHPILDDKYRIVNENGTEVTSQFCKENSCNVLCLNHYFCKSKEEARKKMQRGKISDSKKLDWSTFEDRDRNEVYDPRMLFYAEKLKTAK